MNFYDYSITSNYGTRTDPFTGKTTTHNGVDYALPMNTNVLSNVSGIVTESSYDADGYGNYVVVKDGTGKLHYYAHLNKSNVNVGDIVNVNDSLGLSGSTGRSTGPHLHYEVKSSEGVTSNPIEYTQTGMSTVLPSILPTPEVDDEGNVGIYNPFEAVKDNLSGVVFNIFKYLIIIILIVLFVLFIMKAMDISLI